MEIQSNKNTNKYNKRRKTNNFLNKSAEQQLLKRFPQEIYLFHPINFSPELYMIYLQYRWTSKVFKKLPNRL